MELDFCSVGFSGGFVGVISVEKVLAVSQEEEKDLLT